MNIKTLEALQAFVMTVKHSPATESDLDLVLAGDELDNLIEEEIYRVKAKAFLCNANAGKECSSKDFSEAVMFLNTGEIKDLPEFLKRQSS